METQFERLSAFKKWMQTDFRKKCVDEYGQELFAAFIYPYYMDFMECVEYHMEDLAEEHIQSEEFSIDNESFDFTEED